jgi:CheY-like chemotaxis protein
LLKGRTINYRALVIDIGLSGGIDGWEVARQAREIDSALPVIYHRRARPPMALARCSQQHSFDQAVRASAACLAVSQLLSTR